MKNLNNLITADDLYRVKEIYGCDLVIKNNQNIFFILDEIIDAEFEEI